MAEKVVTRKRIIICCDGTWQSSVSGKKNCPSNVTRLGRVLDRVEDRDVTQWHQVVWYDAGVGSNSMKIGRMVQGAMGNGVDGVDGNIIEAYNFIALNWKKGDQIMCFGFSRGAYTARAIAGLVSDVGICRPEDLDSLPELWEIYKKFHNDENNAEEDFYCSEEFFTWQDGTVSEDQATEYRKNGGFAVKKCHNDWAQEDSRYVEVIGVFDTVKALGAPEVGGVQIPMPSTWHHNHNMRLSRNIGCAFQALALDEHRSSFSPTLFYLPSPVESAKESEVKAQHEVWKDAALQYGAALRSALQLKPSTDGNYDVLNVAASNLNKLAATVRAARKKLIELQDSQRPQPILKQVWFPGYHINIGGGSDETLKDKGDMEEMSSITFAWMLDQLRPYLSINENAVVREHRDRDKHLIKLNLKLEQQKEPWGSWLGRTGKSMAATVLHPFTPHDEPEYKPKQRFYNWGTADMTNSFGPKYWLNGWRVRTPGEYKTAKTDKDLKSDSLPNAVTDTDKTTCEWIHPTVGFRATYKQGYYPSCLTERQYGRQLLKEGYMYRLGNAVLREWPLGGMDSYEWQAVTGELAQQYVQKNVYARVGKESKSMNSALTLEFDHMNAAPTLHFRKQAVLIPMNGCMENSAADPVKELVEDTVDLSDYQVGGFSLSLAGN